MDNVFDAMSSTPAPDVQSKPPAPPVTNAAPTQPVAPAGVATTQPVAPGRLSVPIIPATPENVHHNLLGKIFSVAAGGPEIGYQIDKDTGQMVRTETPEKPGQMWRNILAGALTGLAAGSKVRGPGAGMRSFGAGYEARKEELQKQDQEKRKQAQQQFADQLAADKNAMDNARLALDQQRSVRETQQWDMQKQLWQLDLEKGKYDQAQKVYNDHQKQENDWNLALEYGAKPLVVNGQEARFPTLADATSWSLKNKDVAFHGSSGQRFATIILTDPNTGESVIFEKPKTWNDPQIRKIYNDKGQLVDSGMPITPDEQYKRNKQYLDTQSTKAEINYRNALAEHARRENIKDARQDQMEKEYDGWVAAGSPDPASINPKTKKPYLSFSTRNVLYNQALNEAAKWQVALRDVNKDLSNNPDDEQSKADRDKIEGLFNGAINTVNQLKPGGVKQTPAGTNVPVAVDMPPDVFNKVKDAALGMPVDQALAIAKRNLDARKITQSDYDKLVTAIKESSTPTETPETEASTKTGELIGSTASKIVGAVGKTIGKAAAEGSQLEQ